MEIWYYKVGTVLSCLVMFGLCAGFNFYMAEEEPGERTWNYRRRWQGYILFGVGLAAGITGIYGVFRESRIPLIFSQTCGLSAIVITAVDIGWKTMVRVRVQDNCDQMEADNSYGESCQQYGAFRRLCDGGDSDQCDWETSFKTAIVTCHYLLIFFGCVHTWWCWRFEEKLQSSEHHSIAEVEVQEKRYSVGNITRALLVYVTALYR
eukprot:UN25312